MKQHTYIAIDLKSFYASVECRERGLDPLDTNLVVADDGHTSSTRKIMCAVSELFDRIVDKNLLVRRMYVVANHVLPEADVPKKNDGAVQLDLFTDYAAEEEKQKAEDAALERERKIQAATLAIKKKYGKNAILKAMNLEEGATAKDRNAQIGGHKA